MTKRAQPVKSLPISVTLRQIEASQPCVREYLRFLQDIESSIVTDCYRRDINKDIWERQLSTPLKDPKYGADDQIPLKIILRLKRRNSFSLTNQYRLTWLLTHVKGLKPLNLWLTKQSAALNKTLKAKADKAMARANKAADLAYKLREKAHDMELEADNKVTAYHRKLLQQTISGKA